MVGKLLLVYSIIITIMGILGLLPGITLGTEPIWHAIVKVILGIIGIWVSRSQKET